MDIVLQVTGDVAITSTTTVPTTARVAEAIAYVDRQHARAATGNGWSFAVVDPVTDAALGFVGLDVRRLPRGDLGLGYWLANAHRGRGLAAHALRVLLPWAATIDGARRIEAYVEPGNITSQRTLERVGFRHEGFLDGGAVVGGGPVGVDRSALVSARAEPPPVDPARGDDRR